MTSKATMIANVNACRKFFDEIHKDILPINKPLFNKLYNALVVENYDVNPAAYFIKAFSPAARRPLAVSKRGFQFLFCSFTKEVPEAFYKTLEYNFRGEVTPKYRHLYFLPLWSALQEVGVATFARGDSVLGTKNGRNVIQEFAGEGKERQRKQIIKNMARDNRDDESLTRLIGLMRTQVLISEGAMPDPAISSTNCPAEAIKAANDRKARLAKADKAEPETKVVPVDKPLRRGLGKRT